MKQAINRKYLVNTAIIFNKAKGDDGDNVYYIAVVKGCVKTQDKARMSIGFESTNITRDDIVYFDAIGSVAENKQYAKPREWTLMNDADKLAHWTLRNDDEILIIKTGDAQPAIPSDPTNENEFDAIKSDKWEIRRITNNSAIQDKRGDEVARTITLGA
jgi:hypothetical protein